MGFAADFAGAAFAGAAFAGAGFAGAGFAAGSGAERTGGGFVATASVFAGFVAAEASVLAGFASPFAFFVDEVSAFGVSLAAGFAGFAGGRPASSEMPTTVCARVFFLGSGWIWVSATGSDARSRMPITSSAVRSFCTAR